MYGFWRAEDQWPGRFFGGVSRDSILCFLASGDIACDFLAKNFTKEHRGGRAVAGKNPNREE